MSQSVLDRGYDDQKESTKKRGAVDWHTECWTKGMLDSFRLLSVNGGVCNISVKTYGASKMMIISVRKISTVVYKKANTLKNSWYLCPGIYAWRLYVMGLTI